MIFFNDRYPDSTVTSKNKRIAKFVKGKFETNNETVIERLKPHFRCEESPKVVSGLVVFARLRKEAIEKGVLADIEKYAQDA